MRIIFGGSFDPIHNGHIAMIQYLHQHFPENKIMIMPNTGNLGYKSPHFFSNIDRKNMIEIVVNKNSNICELCDLELQALEYTPTVHSIKTLHEMYPQDVLYFVVGYDSLLNLDTWDNWQELCQSVHFIVFNRESITSELPLKLQDRLTIIDINHITNVTSYSNVSFADMANIDISSTIIRTEINLGMKSWQRMVDQDVAIYIESIIDTRSN